MLLSMTGFGSANGNYLNRTISIEIRSLNSKFTDLRYKIPPSYREKEAILRKLVTTRGQRGKIELTIDVSSPEIDNEYSLNLDLYRKYYKELSAVNREMGHDKDSLTEAIIRIPNVVASSREGLEDEEWKAALAVLNEALDNFMAFRKTEGEAMEADCQDRIQNILTALTAVEPFENKRVDKLRQRVNQNLEEYVGKDKIDANRFEQEILYYMEKIDITEEKVRLTQHCKYFLEEMGNSKELKGRKLNFIAQEIGREINTLGSKANDSDIQKLVVGMKDELEKIKEQVLNTI